MIRLRVAAAASVLACSFAIAQSAKQAVLRLDPALDALVSSDASVELVKSGFGFTRPGLGTAGQSGLSAVHRHAGECGLEADGGRQGVGVSRARRLQRA